MENSLLQLWEIFVPDTKEITKEVHSEWCTKVAKEFGGLTLSDARQESISLWFDKENDTVVKELIFPVLVACKESELDKLISITKEIYNQKEVMVYRKSDLVIIK